MNSINQVKPTKQVEKVQCPKCGKSFTKSGLGLHAKSCKGTADKPTIVEQVSAESI
jgi:tRNA(Ile2) C34 agmatinyltransferase TiaS